MFTAGAVVMGLLWGSTWTVTRAVMTYLTPPEKLNFAFTFYTLAERFSTFIGPLSWGLIVSGLTNLGTTRYRLALATMGLFVLIGLIIVRKIPSRREHAQLTQTQ